MNTRTYMIPKRTLETTFRGWFRDGGYRDCDTYDEARSATSPMRGPVVRVDKIDVSIMWETVKEVSAP